jgi:hypothetical protein
MAVKQKLRISACHRLLAEQEAKQFIAPQGEQGMPRYACHRLLAPQGGDGKPAIK